MFVSVASTPTRNPTIYDLHKRKLGSNIPDDLISGSRWITPLTGKPYSFQTKKAPSLDFVKREQQSSFIFGGGSKETQADKIAKAHFREVDRRAYDDFLTSSRTYWLTNAPQPPQPLEAEKPVLKIETTKKRRGRKPKMPDSGIGGSPLREQVIF